MSCYPGPVAQQGRAAGGGTMADDRDARIAELEAEVAALRQREGTLQGQLTATTDVLHAMASSGHDLHVTLVELESRICLALDSAHATIYRVDGTVMRRVGRAEVEPGAAWAERPINRLTIAGRVILDR